MPKRQGFTPSLVTLILLLAPCSFPQASTKKKVTSQADLPRFTYPIRGSASDLLQSDDATFNAFAARVRGDLDSTFRDYEVGDKATLRLLLQAKLDLHQLAGENQAALETIASLRAEEEKPAARLTTALFTSAVLKAAIETKSSSGEDFEKSVAKYYREAIDSLPWSTVQDSIRHQLSDYQLIGKAYVIGEVKDEIDPSVAKSGAVDASQAWKLIGYRNDLRFLRLRAASGVDVLRNYIAAHNVQKPDIWAAREVTLTADQKLTPVLVGIWDNGIDVSVFGDQVFTDPHPTASGPHGLAFDQQGNPSQSWLYPLNPEQQEYYATTFRADYKGLADLDEGVDSQEAKALREKVSASTPDQMNALFETFGTIERYAHGTHVAGISVRGNPAARLVAIRFMYGTDLPSPPAPTEERMSRMVADSQQVSEYLKTRNVRVVNMSWGNTLQNFELLVSRTTNQADPAMRKKRAAELFESWRGAIESAIENASNTLFVCSAGNTDSDATFTQHVPSAFRLPNLIAVGAVNQAGDETGFSSYGSTVVVDADGYYVASTVPGGGAVKGWGTSVSTANVTNLAAKLFALDPSLTPEQVIDLIKRGATTSEDGRRHLIDEKRSVALLEEQAKN